MTVKLRVYAPKGYKFMDEMIASALELLPAAGSKVEFDVYKSKLYAANPEKGRDVFAYMIKRDLVQKELSRNSDGAVVVMLSRKATK